MKDAHLKLILAGAAIALAGWYFLQGNERLLKTATTSTTMEEGTTTMEEDTRTPVTTLWQDPNALPECLMMKTACKRDRCHFGNALNRHNEKICDQIADITLKSSCYQKVAENQTLTQPAIEGQVFNTKTCGAYQNLTVELRDETANATKATTWTNWRGEYSFEATTGNDYGIYVTIGDIRLNQNVSANANKRYVIDFALS
ncbi:MAG: hypothetical protein PHG85_00470 [Candidatus Altiarchaeota archaeon]|nr:hypothetical protein [Candidatus Altiarchaeota archaeon]